MTQLKRDYLSPMLREKTILNAGFSSTEKRNVGYVVNSKLAFNQVPSADSRSTQLSCSR